MGLPSALAKNGSVLKKAALASIPGRPSDVTGTTQSPHIRLLFYRELTACGGGSSFCPWKALSRLFPSI